MARINKEFISGSIILLITFNLFNLINFLFQFVMARKLSSADYSILATLFSFIYLSTIFSEPIMTLVAKYSSQEKDNSKIKNLLARSIKKSFKFSLIIFIIYILVAIPLSFVLKIPYLLLSSTGLMIFSSFLPPINRGIMQGKKMFKYLGLNLLFEATLKILFAILLVSIGWRVYGAMFATIIAFIIAFLFSFFAFKDIMKSKEKFIKIPSFYSYSLPSFIILFSVLIFFSLDIIIARIVFEPTTAGYYAIASTLAKTIFFATQPISKAMFPIASEKKQKGHNLFANALILIFICIIPTLVISYVFPDLLIRLFSGNYILESINIFFYLCIATSLLSLVNLIVFYKISLNKTKSYFIFFLFPIIEIILLLIFSHNLIEYSLAFITSSAIFLWATIVLFDK